MAHDANLSAAFADPVLAASGAFGQVYRALGPEGEPVAVKVLAAELATRPGMAWSFAREFRRLAELDHPAIPRARGEGYTTDGRPLFWMSWAEGRPVDAEAPVAPTRARALLAEAAEALAYLHGRGLVHGDVKPANVLVADDGRLALLDVGLAARTGERREEVAGTPAYMAPEVLRRAPAAPAADMYALGVLAFVLLTGEPPYAGSTAELVRAVLTGPAPRLPAAVRAADPELADMVEALLAKEPTSRPAAATVVQALGGGGAATAARDARLQGGALVGREPVLAAWRKRLAERRGRLAIAGQPGSGKSRLLDELRVEALAAGLTWLGASCAAAGAPAAPLRALVGQALARAGLQASPPLAAWIAGEQTAAQAELDPGARLVAVAVEAASALRMAACAVGGLAIGLDDWQRADDVTRELLARIGPIAADAPIAWVVAESAPPPDAGAEADPATQWLAPLDERAAEALTTARLGGEPPAGLLAWLLPRGRGLPALLDRWLEFLVDVGALKASPEGWRFEPDAAARGRAGTGVLQEAWSQEIARLPEPARRLAGMVALAEDAGAIEIPWLAAEAGLDGDEALAAVDVLLAAGLVCESEGRLRLRFPAQAEVLAGGLAQDARSRHAEGLARRILGLPAGAPPGPEALAGLRSDQVVRAALLAAQGADDRLAALASAEAGQRALALGDPRKALALLETALARGPAELPEAWRIAVRLGRADSRRRLDDLAGAAADYAEAERAALARGAHEAAATAAFGLAKCEQMRGDYAACAATLQRAADAARAVGALRLMARVRIARARVELFLGDAGAAEAECREALALVPDAPALRREALDLLGVLIVQRDPQRAAEGLAMLDEALANAATAGDRYGESGLWESIGNVRLAIGDLPGAEEAFARYVALSRALGNETEALAGELNLAIVAKELRAPDAQAQAAGVAGRAAASGRPFVRALALALVGVARWRAEDPAAGQAALEEAAAIADGIGSAYLAAHVDMLRLEAMLEAGALTGALPLLDALAARPLVADDQELAQRLAVWRAEATRLLGRAEEADATAAALAHSPSLVVARLAARVQALAALDRGDEGAARGHAARAAAIAAGWGATALVALDRALAGEAQPTRPASAGEVARQIRPAELRGYLEALAEASDERELGDRLLDAVMRLTSADRGYMLAYEDGRLRQACARGIDPDSPDEAGYSRSIADAVMLSAEPRYVVDAANDPAWRAAASVAALELRTVIALPLATPERLLGVVYMDRATIEPLLAEDDVELLWTLATAGAMRLEEARVRRQLAERARLAELAAALGAELLRTPDASRPDVLLTHALRLSDAERAFLLEHDPQAGWRARAARARDGGTPSFAHAEVSMSALEWVRTHGEPIGLFDGPSGPDLAASRSVQALGLHMLWCVPAGRHAVLYLDARHARDDEPAATLRALEALAAYAASGVADAPG